MKIKLVETGLNKLLDSNETEPDEIDVKINLSEQRKVKYRLTEPYIPFVKP